jgi:hypothetical protein
MHQNMGCESLVDSWSFRRELAKGLAITAFGFPGTSELTYSLFTSRFCSLNNTSCDLRISHYRTVIMNTEHIALMGAEEISQSLKTVRLEQAYERALRQSERIYEEERSRTLRLEYLLLAHENDALQNQLAEVEARLERLEDHEEEAQEQLGQLDADLQCAQNDLRARTREVERYRAELNAMSTVTTDSTKLLTEKLALAREVATLKPEIEHLRSQVALNQNILAEKLALQRELSTLQVELETERRAVQRTKANTTKSTEGDSKAASQLEDLRKELAKERREAQKNERESRKHATEWESQKTILESKVDAFRTKLRSRTEQLKETQKELEESQALKAAKKAESLSTKSNVANARKRQTAHFDPDATIGTPGNNGVHAAKRARVSTLPGDKSTFSITPFLNRTMSILPDTPDVNEQPEIPQAQGELTKTDGEQTSPIRPKQAKARKAPAVSKKERGTRVLQETKAAQKANVIIQKDGKSTAKEPFGLAKVVEEDNDENEEAADTLSELTKASKPTVKKKQKILGQRQSLFDDDDAEETKSRARKIGLLGASRGLGLRGGGRLGPISLSSKGRQLAEFSPLKKDRRASSLSVA